MAPPKRKSGGRVTPSGTRPGDRPKTPGRSDGHHHDTTVTASSRYTPPVPRAQTESPPWLPVLMLALFVIGGLAIMSRYLIWESSQIPLLIGLACLLAGLYTATKWR